MQTEYHTYSDANGHGYERRWHTRSESMHHHDRDGRATSEHEGQEICVWQRRHPVAQRVPQIAARARGGRDIRQLTTGNEHSFTGNISTHNWLGNIIGDRIQVEESGEELHPPNDEGQRDPYLQWCCTTRADLRGDGAAHQEAERVRRTRAPHAGNCGTVRQRWRAPRPASDPHRRRQAGDHGIRHPLGNIEKGDRATGQQGARCTVLAGRSANRETVDSM